MEAIAAAVVYPSSSAHAREPLPVARAAVPAKVLRRLEHLNQFGDEQHAREVDIQTRDVLQIAVEISCAAAIVVSASSALARRIERRDDDVDGKLGPDSRTSGQ
jgi:hypothetical protein